MTAIVCVQESKSFPNSDGHLQRDLNKSQSEGEHRKTPKSTHKHWCENKGSLWQLLHCILKTQGTRKIELNQLLPGFPTLWSSTLGTRYSFLALS